MSSSVSSLAQSPIVLTAVLEPVVLEARLVSLLLLTISAAARVVRSRVSSRCSSGDTECRIKGEKFVFNRFEFEWPDFDSSKPKIGWKMILGA